MRYLLIFIGAAVVAYLLALGIRAFMAGRQAKEHANEQPSEHASEQPGARRPPYRIK